MKGINFINLRDAGDPVDNAKMYDGQGADELCFLDITASHEKRKIILDVVARTAEEVFMPLTVGGGINTLHDIRDLLNAGADKVSINTGAVKQPGFVQEAAERFGSQCIVVAIDAKRVSTGVSGELHWEVYTHGGREPTGIDVLEWTKRIVSYGAGEILLTSMDSDGTKEGFDIALTQAVSECASVPVIASGGAGTLDHLYQVLKQGKADAVLAASIFHYKEFSIGEVKRYLRERSIPVR